MKTFLVSLIILTGVFISLMLENTKPFYIIHRVESGETVDMICAKYASQYGDRRPIDAIRWDVITGNSIGKYIHPGDEIVVRLEIEGD